MKIFITGASGFVGTATAKALVEAGHSVTAMSRRDETDTYIAALGASPLRCNLENVNASHLSGVEVIVHCAAFVGSWGPKDAWHKGNVVGTQTLLAAAKAAGVKRFVHIGTEAGIVHGQHINGADETYPLCPNSPYPYCATKAQAEQLVVAANSDQLETIVLRPRFIWGPGDQTLLPAIKAMADRGNWTWINNGEAKTSTIYIDNLVHAIQLALAGGIPGQAYFILDDEVSSIKEIISAMAVSQNLKLADKNVPSWLADAIGSLCEGIWRLFNLKGEPPLTRHAAMVVSRDCVLNGDKAKRELAYQPLVTVEQGIKNMQL